MCGTGLLLIGTHLAADEIETMTYASASEDKCTKLTVCLADCPEEIASLLGDEK